MIPWWCHRGHSASPWPVRRYAASLLDGEPYFHLRPNAVCEERKGFLVAVNTGLICDLCRVFGSSNNSESLVIRPPSPNRIVCIPPPSALSERLFVWAAGRADWCVWEPRSVSPGVDSLWRRLTVLSLRWCISPHMCREFKGISSGHLPPVKTSFYVKRLRRRQYVRRPVEQLVPLDWSIWSHGRRNSSWSSSITVPLWSSRHSVAATRVGHSGHWN